MGRSRLAVSLFDGVVTDMVAVDIQAEDPDAMAERWANAVGRPVSQGIMALDDAEIRFVQATDGRETVWRRQICALRIGPERGETLNLCGFQFRLV